jgi:hypothetical protein
MLPVLVPAASSTNKPPAGSRYARGRARLPPSRAIACLNSRGPERESRSLRLFPRSSRSQVALGNAIAQKAVL